MSLDQAQVLAVQNFVKSAKDKIMLAKKKHGGCFVFVGGSQDNVEVCIEVDENDVTGTMFLQKAPADESKEMAREVAEEITKSTGCKVFSTRSEWTNACGA